MKRLVANLVDSYVVFDTEDNRVLVRIMKVVVFKAHRHDLMECGHLLPVRPLLGPSEGRFIRHCVKCALEVPPSVCSVLRIPAAERNQIADLLRQPLAARPVGWIPPLGKNLGLRVCRCGARYEVVEGMVAIRPESAFELCAGCWSNGGFPKFRVAEIEAAVESARSKGRNKKAA